MEFWSFYWYWVLSSALTTGGLLALRIVLNLAIGK